MPDTADITPSGSQKSSAAPPAYNKNKTFERFETEIECWSLVTKTPKEDQGMLLALSLPDESMIKEQVFDKFKATGLNVADG